MTSKTSEILHTFYSTCTCTTYYIHTSTNSTNHYFTFHYMYMYVHVHNNSIPAGIIYAYTQVGKLSSSSSS